MEEDDWSELFLTEQDSFQDYSQSDNNMGVWVGRPMPDHYLTRRYAEGFRVSARLLTRTALENPHSADFRMCHVVYPVVFLYRHNIELLLKLLIKDSLEILEREGRVPMHHEIDGLWAKAWPLVDEAFGEAIWERSQHGHVTRLLSEWVKFDPNGEAARYPNDKRDTRHFEELDLLNVRHFADVAERLSEYLDHLVEGLEITLESLEEERRC